ncbi:hypothetical protein E34_1397 [Lactococcus lactis subsp. lactis]|uniref:Uncharacterized protein n=1 Tax=Lactococcus lactis TaxID=1358 RepID=A0AAP3Z3E0_9LACT|nr:hypothetical protein [Lactococcus lactis]KST78803.1 hypothetical protein E34_1397 [Lactococcus lactis subsp. lactis]MCT0449881.1 hypothetical protein [Lactococcus lactis subsp. lactis]MCT1192000.1 hypothetical protein [Lactococcus lactis]MDG4977653.1 hypothetical protein [Lactococcus lactis]MDG4986579.1 hypothetical protein [Lactococcus lactis]
MKNSLNKKSLVIITSDFLFNKFFYIHFFFAWLVFWLVLFYQPSKSLVLSVPTTLFTLIPQ